MIKEDVYLLAKEIVKDYEKQSNEDDIMLRNFTYTDMKDCFNAGINRGCYIASVLQGRPIDAFPVWKEFIKEKCT